MQQGSKKYQVSLLNIEHFHPSLNLSDKKLPKFLGTDESQTFRGTREEELDPLSFFTQKVILTHTCDSRPGVQPGQSGHCLGVCRVLESWLAAFC